MATITKAVVCSFDNLRNLKESVAVLREEPIDQIVIVNNGSKDGTYEWLEEQGDILAVHKDNDGAGPGRNAGLNAAGEFDYVLMLDGGIRALHGGTQRMLDYLHRRQDADVIGIQIADFETDYQKAWYRWPSPILDSDTFLHTRLSHTAYCICRARAWDGLRFSEEGPFGQPGWGADDDEMACQWQDSGISIHVVVGIHPYRRASGSFHRLYQETGIWPNQYGSVYEQRVVWLQQNYPQYEQGMQWGEPYITVVIKANGIDSTAMIVKQAHDQLRQRRFEKPWEWWSNPYSIVVWGSDQTWLDWAEARRLRQHHGTTTVADGEIVRRNRGNEATWTGDFRIWQEHDWEASIRPKSHYYGLVTNKHELEELLDCYNELHPPQSVKNPPSCTREKIYG